MQTLQPKSIGYRRNSAISGTDFKAVNRTGCNAILESRTSANDVTHRRALDANNERWEPRSAFRYFLPCTIRPLNEIFRRIARCGRQMRPGGISLFKDRHRPMTRELGNTSVQGSRLYVCIDTG